MSGGPCCGHVRVELLVVKDDDGTCSDRWICSECGCGFVPIGMPPLKGDTLAADYAEAGSGWREQQEGDDVRWERMTSRERTAVLRAKVKTLEGVEDSLDASLSITNRSMMDLARRVAEIEQAQAKPLHASHGQAAGWGAEWCDVRELARLRRVEEAARAVDSWDPILCGVNDDGMLLDLHKLTLALRAALDSEPKR